MNKIETLLDWRHVFSRATVVTKAPLTSFTSNMSRTADKIVSITTSVSRRTHVDLERGATG